MTEFNSSKTAPIPDVIPRSDVDTGGLGLLDVLVIAMRRWRLLLSVLVTTAIAATLWVIFTPKVFESTFQLQEKNAPRALDRYYSPDLDITSAFIANNALSPDVIATANQSLLEKKQNIGKPLTSANIKVNIARVDRFVNISVFSSDPLSAQLGAKALLTALGDSFKAKGENQAELAADLVRYKAQLLKLDHLIAKAIDDAGTGKDGTSNVNDLVGARVKITEAIALVEHRLLGLTSQNVVVQPTLATQPTLSSPIGRVALVSAIAFLLTVMILIMLEIIRRAHTDTSFKQKLAQLRAELPWKYKK